MILGKALYRVSVKNSPSKPFFFNQHFNFFNFYLGNKKLKFKYTNTLDPECLLADNTSSQNFKDRINIYYKF